VVLATGNQIPAAPAALSHELLRSNRLIRDPWNGNALTAIDPGENVLLIGTGLTALDVLLALRSQDHRGRVVAVSRRGLLPRPHLAPDDPRRRAVTLDVAQLPRQARLLSRHLRTEARRLEKDGVGWQCLIDAMRPVITDIWMGLPPPEKARFMRRLRPFWEVVRHRGAPESLAAVDAWRARGGLEILSGSVLAVTDAEDALDVTLGLRGESRRLRFDRIVLCTGPETDVRRWTSSLFRQLVGERSIQADPLAIGIVTDAKGRSVGPEDKPVPWLFTIGGLRRPHLWETTSVPDIVRQARALVEPLAEAAGLDVQR
jgi:uncharacterized NAD(P)/FAD-binding protein YdhS